MDIMKQFWEEEDGMGTVEIVMIIAALMCIALLFRKQIFAFAQGMRDKGFDSAGTVFPAGISAA